MSLEDEIFLFFFFFLKHQLLRTLNFIYLFIYSLHGYYFLKNIKLIKK